MSSAVVFPVGIPKRGLRSDTPTPQPQPLPAPAYFRDQNSLLTPRSAEVGDTAKDGEDLLWEKDRGCVSSQKLRQKEQGPPSFL